MLKIVSSILTKNKEGILQMPDTVILYYQPFPGRGTLWSNNRIIVVPPGWNGGKYLGWNLFWYPVEGQREKLSFQKDKDLRDFLTLFYEASIQLENPKSILERPSDPTTLPAWGPVTSDLVDTLFIETPDTEENSPFVVKFIEYQRQNTPAARYAQTAKGKLTQKKYRQGTKSKEGIDRRKKHKQRLQEELTEHCGFLMDESILPEEKNKRYSELISKLESGELQLETIRLKDGILDF